MQGEVRPVPPGHRPGLPQPAARGVGDTGQHPGRHRLCRPGLQRSGEPGGGERPRQGPRPPAGRLAPAERPAGQREGAGVAAVQAGTPGGGPATLRVRKT